MRCYRARTASPSIPDITKVAFIFGGRHGNGVLVVRDKLSSPWSDPSFVCAHRGKLGSAGGRPIVGHHSGVHHQDRHRRHRRRQADAGRRRLGCHGPGRPAGIGGDRHHSSPRSIPMRARAACSAASRSMAASSRSIDRQRGFYGRARRHRHRLFSGLAPAPPATAQRFLARPSQSTHTAVRGSPAPQADMPAAAPSSRWGGNPAATRPRGRAPELIRWRTRN